MADLRQLVFILTATMAGFASGFYINSKAEKEAVQPFSAKSVSTEFLDDICVRNSAIQSLRNQSFSPNEKSTFILNSVRSVPLSDKGIICNVEGRFVKYFPRGSVESATINKVVLLAPEANISEFIDAEFAAKLLASNAVEQIGSNVGEPDREIDKSVGSIIIR